jgi:hypothetical protein
MSYPSADNAMTEMAMNPKAKMKTYVIFEHVQKENLTKSKEAGRPIFEDVEYIRKIVPGDSSSTIHKPVTDWDRRNYADEYQAFVTRKSEQVVGTPIELFPGISKTQALEFKAVGIITIEHLAHISDANVSRFMGGQALRKRAADFLAAAEGNAPTTRLNKELEERDSKIATLERALKEQGEQIAKLEKSNRK